MELLLDYISGRRTKVATVRIPTRLIVRESCGCQPYSRTSIGVHDTVISAGGAAAPFDLPMLIQAMSDAMSAEARYSSVALIGDWCQSLVAAFLASLDHEDPQPFAEALDHLLQEAEAANEDAYPWQAAISVLREQADALCAERSPTALRHVAESLIDQARVRISERLRRQHTRFWCGRPSLQNG